MSYRAKSDSSSGLGLIVTLLLLCMGGTVFALQSQTRQPAARVYVAQNPEPAKLPGAVVQRDYLSAGRDQASR
jgi:hypothetical protein